MVFCVDKINQKNLIKKFWKKYKGHLWGQFGKTKYTEKKDNNLNDLCQQNDESVVLNLLHPFPFLG